MCEGWSKNDQIYEDSPKYVFKILVLDSHEKHRFKAWRWTIQIGKKEETIRKRGRWRGSQWFFVIQSKKDEGKEWSSRKFQKYFDHKQTFNSWNAKEIGHADAWKGEKLGVWNKRFRFVENRKYGARKSRHQVRYVRI